MKKFKMTEQQFASVLSEIDVDAITKAAQEYGTTVDTGEKKFNDTVSKAILGDKAGVTEDNEKNIEKNLDESKNCAIFAERNFTKKQIYESVSKFYERASSSKAKN